MIFLSKRALLLMALVWSSCSYGMGCEELVKEIQKHSKEFMSEALLLPKNCKRNKPKSECEDYLEESKRHLDKLNKSYSMIKKSCLQK